MRRVSGIRIDDELCIPNVLSQDPRVDCRDHDIVGAVYDERGLLDRLELRETLAFGLAALEDCRVLNLCGLRRGRRVDTQPALTPLFPGGLLSIPKVPTGALGRLRRREQQEKVFFQTENRATNNLIHARIDSWLLRARRGAYKHQTTNEVRMTQNEGLRAVSSDGEAEHTQLGQFQGSNKRCRLIGHSLDGVRRFTARTRHAGIVEQDDRTISSETVQQ